MRHLNCKSSVNIKNQQDFPFQLVQSPANKQSHAAKFMPQVLKWELHTQIHLLLRLKRKTLEKKLPSLQKSCGKVANFLPNQVTGLLQNGLSFRLQGNSILDLRKHLWTFFLTLQVDARRLTLFPRLVKVLFILRKKDL